MTARRIRFVCAFIATMAVLGLRTAPLAGTHSPLTQVELVGVFSADWMDPDPASGLEPTVRYFLKAPESSQELFLSAYVLDAAGGGTRLQGRRVRAYGSMSQGSSASLFQVHRLELLDLPGEAGGEGIEAIPAGAFTKWLSILCKYADDPAAPATFDYMAMYANVRPGLDHYWREVSYGAHAMGAGSHTMGWFVLPKAKAQYLGNEYEADCRALADPFVHFPDYDGITVILNGQMGNGQFNGGGGSSVLTLDGITKTYGITILSIGATIGTAAHEMGHAYGLFHSSGDYNVPYDNFWDNMSSSRAQHLNAYQKELLGWLPGRRLDVGAGSSLTVQLDTLALPSLGWQMLKIPIPGTHRYYTVESRLRAGLDDVLPGDAVIIHDVDLTRALDRRARVVDGDLNGNAMDAGAMWQPGESFVDAAFGITITVNSQTVAGFSVTVTVAQQSGPPPTILADPSPVVTSEYGMATFTVSALNATAYAWEISTNNGTSWSPVIDDWKFSGTFTPTLTNAVSWEHGALFRVVVWNGVGSVTSGAASLSVSVWERLLNGNFSNGLTNWVGFATPSASYLSAAVVNGVLEFFRVPPPPGQSNQAVVLQSSGVPVPFGPGIDHYTLHVEFRAGNSSNVRKRLSLLVHDADFSDLSVCTFWLAPHTPLTSMDMTTHVTQAWSNSTISFYAATEGSDGGTYLLDDVKFYGRAAGVGTVVRDTLCNGVPPAAASGSPGPELLLNGNFASGLVSWSTYGQIVGQVTGGVVEFLRPPGDPAGVILQPTFAAVAEGAVITSTFDLGNSSAVRKRVTVLVHDGDFSDLSACTFWIPPGQPPTQYKLRTRPTKAWSNATLSIYAATVGNEGWILLDNASLRLTPDAAGVTSTLCVEPGSTR